MNDKIKDIALESMVKYIAGDAWSFTTEELQHFGESIVKECANELLKWKSQPFPYDPEFGARLIKDHFGIRD